MATRFYSKAQLVLREAWRKAYKDGEVKIVLPTPAKAHKLRFDLYAAVKAEKKNDSEDLELMMAAQTVEIVLGESKNILLMRPRSKSDVFQALEEATGLTIDNVTDPTLKEAESKSLEHIQHLIGGEQSPEDKAQAEKHKSKFGL